jgi:hypothetical protein
MWVGPRVGLDEVGKKKCYTLPVLELRTHGVSALSQSLHQLRYPDSPYEQCSIVYSKIIGETAPWLKRLVAGFPPRRPVSRPGLASGICGGQSVVGAGFLRVLRFPLPKPFNPPTSPSSQSPGAGTIGQECPQCRVNPVWTPPSIFK